MGKKNEDIKILVVEDETILALQLKMSLQKFGYGISGVKQPPMMRCVMSMPICPIWCCLTFI